MVEHPAEATLRASVLHASDIRRGLERVLRTNRDTAAFYTSIRGALRCLGRKAPCDLSAGIQVDDAAGTITFRLTAPDPDPDPSFLYKLALRNAVAVAPGCCSSRADRCPPPALHDRRTQRPWAAAAGAQPALPTRRRPARRLSRRHHDRLLCRHAPGAWRGGAGLCGPGRRGLRAPQLGNVDGIAARYAGQLHTTPMASTSFAFLNTHTPPSMTSTCGVPWAMRSTAAPSWRSTEARPTRRPRASSCPRTSRATGPIARIRRARRRAAVEGPRSAVARRLIARSHTQGCASP